jgi:RsiW-degrading membrane proteinase PrsW (M82 family)
MTAAELPIAMPAPPRGRDWRPLVGLLFVVDAVFLIVNGIWFAAYLRDEGPPFSPDAGELIWVGTTTIVLGLIVAAPAFALISRLARGTEVPLGAAVSAVLLGFLAFLAAAQINDWIVLTLDIVPGPAPDGGIDAFGVIVAPLVEEPAKLFALFAIAFLLGRRFGVRQGIVLGLLVGIGATLLETGAYLQVGYANGGGAVYGTIIALRFGLFGLGLHATTAALLGAGLGSALSVGRGRRRIGVVLLALAAAVAIHVLWNVWASRLTFELVTAWTPEPDFGSSEPFAHHVVWIASSVVTAALLLGPALILAIAWGSARPTPGPLEPGTEIVSEPEPAVSPP